MSEIILYLKLVQENSMNCR